MRRLSLRRSDQDAVTDDEPDDVRADPPRQRERSSPKQRGGERDQTPAHTTKIEKAAERAATAARTAAARAAAARAHARPRNSGLASLGLVLAVVASLTVATGALAGPGLVLGVVALLVAIAATSTTSRHYHFLAGRTEALVGLVLALGAVVLGVLALTGALTWLDTGTNNVEQLREYLPSWLT